MKNYLPAFIILCLCLVFVGCGADEKKYKIGVSQCSQDDWRKKMNDEIYRETLLHDDAMVEIRSADDSNEKQIADIDYFVKNHFDIIVVSPNEAAALTPIIKKVYESGTPVVIFDRNINDTTYTARIGVDDKGLGRSAATYAHHLLGPGVRALEIYGLPGSTPADDRHEGFAETLSQNGGTLIGGAPANWNKEDAIPVVDSLLTCHPDVNLIYAHNDRMAIGASEVARRRGRHDIKIIGIDAAPDIGIRAVADSVIDATFLYPTEGHRLVKTALAILKKQPYQRETILPVSSAVDKTNADILLLQNETLKEETRKIVLLKNNLDNYWAQYSAQTVLFYACVAIIVLLFGVGFLLFRAYWQHRKHQKQLTAKNKLLEQERDKQAGLNEQLQQATQSKLRFFTNVSHDLRTPLTLIAEPVASLAEAPNLTSQQHTLIKLANKNVKIIKRMIDQILDFRKHENGKLNLNLVEFDLGKALEGWVESFHTIALKHDVKLSLIHPPSPQSAMMALDPEKMERIAFNLISNALKHTPRGGKITVTYDIQADLLKLSVADTGEGISAGDLGHIFDRFFQTESIHPEGSGIGLALVKAFVELHGGTITATSTPGKGSNFAIELPIRHVTTTSALPPRKIDETTVSDELEPIADSHTFDENKPLVLIVDDNKDMQTLVGELLSADYNILTASNGKAGLRLAVKNVPDLIVCDNMMPVMDGLELCRRVKAEVTTSHIPVLMLTACSMDEQRAQGYESGADGYLSKPFDSRVLRSRCHSLIEGRKRVQQLWQGPAPVRVEEAGKANTPSRNKIPATDIDDEFYQRFLTIFKEEMSCPNLNVDQLAAKMNLERSQFYRKIKALTGHAPVELIRRLRLENARALLLTTELSVGEIAYKIGFSSPAYFTKCYREAYDETPSQVRSRLTKR